MIRSKHLFVILIALCAGACSVGRETTSSTDVERAFEQKAKDVKVSGEGVVERILSDDRDGSPHQRFILRLASGQTILVSHNIALAPRINDIKTGDKVSFSGEYVWNEQGGMIHWTHHDPAGRHPGGWLKHNGRTYK